MKNEDLNPGTNTPPSDPEDPQDHPTKGTLSPPKQGAAKSDDEEQDHPPKSPGLPGLSKPSAE